MKLNRTIAFVLLLVFVTSHNQFKAQTEEELYKVGIKYKTEVNNKKMLQVFKKLVELNADNVEYQANLSFAYSKVGANLDDAALQLKYYAKAKSIATTAKQLDDNNAMAHYSYALALARENENAKTKVKIANAKDIKSECDKALKLNPSLGGVYHVLGRWHRTLAGFNNMEKAMVNTFYGGVPKGGSFKDALEMFEKAIKLEPWYMLHVYELAVTYHEMKNDEYAIKYLEKAMKLPQSYEDAKICYKACEKLLSKLKQ